MEIEISGNTRVQIEIGEYAKTKTGRIINIKTINIVKYTLRAAKAKKRAWAKGLKRILINGKYELEDIVKHSKNIIDLIEVGDFVNCKKVIEVRNQNGKIYLITDYVPQKYLKGEIKSIVTKEQFEQIQYKIDN